MRLEVYGHSRATFHNHSPELRPLVQEAISSKANAFLDGRRGLARTGRVAQHGGHELRIFSSADNHHSPSNRCRLDGLQKTRCCKISCRDCVYYCRSAEIQFYFNRPRLCLKRNDNFQDDPFCVAKHVRITLKTSSRDLSGVPGKRAVESSRS